MAQILVENLMKTFRVAERRAGLWGAFAGLVRRTYHGIQALAGIDFAIEESELVGYIGPNGAGKSTTVKILSGILVPTAGRCEVNGVTPWKQRVQHVQNIGVVFGQRTQLWWDLPVIESFEVLRAIYRIPPAVFRQNSARLIELLQLHELLDMPVRQLSLGQRMRSDLAAALLHGSRLLFLDEPTIGLDAVSKLAVRDFIKMFNRDEGVTVILTTHDMDDIEALCQRVMVIGRGKIVSDGSLQALRATVNNERRLIVDLVNAHEVVEEPAARVVERHGRRVELAFDPREVSPAQLISRIAAKHAIQDLFVEHPSIERIIAELYARHGELRGMKRFLPYMAVVSARYRMLLQYRAAAFAGLVTQCFWGAIKLMIFAAFYAASKQDQPMSLPEVVTYIWLGQVFFAMLPWNIDGEFAQKVRDGSVAYDLLRPVDLYALWYSHTLAYRAAPTTLRAIPLVLFAMLVLPRLGLVEWALGTPPSLLSCGLFGVSLVAAGALSTAITMLSHISLLSHISAAGMDRIMPAVVTLFSGMVLPLPLFPNWLQPLLHWQPFRGLVDVPCRIYSGNILPTVALLEIVHQGVWIGLLVWLGRVMLARGTRNLVVQGG